LHVMGSMPFGSIDIILGRCPVSLVHCFSVASTPFSVWRMFLRGKGWKVNSSLRR
jgi:hypothetical protein